MENLEAAIAEIKKELPGMTLLENEAMNTHTSMKVGGAVRAYAAPQDVGSLSKLCCILKEHGHAPYILGNGTNVVFPDAGCPDLFVVSTGKLDQLFICGDGKIYAGSGVSLSKLATFAQQNALAGLEFASGIPGTLRSITSSVASGVTSLSENPVPPVVTINSAIASSAILFISFASISLSSGSKIA